MATPVVQAEDLDSTGESVGQQAEEENGSTSDGQSTAEIDPQGDGAATKQVPELTEEAVTAFLDDFFAAESTQPYYVGASVSIVKDGELLVQKGYGHTDLTGQEPVDPASTVFRIASVSKTFTAAAALQLAEQGKLDLQEEFTAYLDGVTYENPYGTPVTIEHLLTHTTGFEVRDPNPSDIHTELDQYVAIEDFVREHMPPVVREPGTSYMYDNFASLLLGYVVQEASGMPFEDYMKQYMFEPLGMANSGYVLEEKLVENLAAGHDMLGNPLEVYTVTPTVMPHGGMMTTAEDVGKFMIALQNGGMAEGGRILSEESVKLMEQYQSAIHPLLPDTTYGFEAPFQLPGAGSHPGIITKAGDLNGYSSYLFLIPEENVGVFLTYNQMGVLRNLFYPQFISTFYPEYAAPASLDENFRPMTAEQLEKFSGLYADLRLDVFVSTVEVNGSGSLLISDALLGPRELTQVDDALFVDALTNQFTAFQLDEKGQVLYMKEPYINPLGYAAKGKEPAGFIDVGNSDPFAPFIHGLQSLGHYDNSGAAAFEPERSVTRAEYVERMMVVSNVKGSKAEAYAFTDIAGHPAAPYIQAAYEMGLVAGDGQGLFEPDRIITRQEAAVLIWNSLKLQYPEELFADVQIADDISEWAQPAVRMIVALGLYGPEVQIDADGTVHYLALNPLTRQEEAAILYKLLTQPTDVIVSQLLAAQAGEAQ
ncbi:penicillin-binding protein [Xylanibacillus composti]|nr:penicillin-binding protein [Xylanibacillus composti]